MIGVNTKAQVGCPGSEDPQMCLKCTREICKLDENLRKQKRRAATMHAVQKTPETIAFGDWLRTQRFKRHLLGYQLAHKLDITQGHVSALETGRGMPAEQLMAKIEDYLGDEEAKQICRSHLEWWNENKDSLRKQRYDRSQREAEK